MARGCQGAKERSGAELTKKHKLSEVIEFGEALIRTGDLDPVYIALVNAARDGKGSVNPNYPLAKPGQVQRLLLAYFCFYHLGVAAYISEYEGVEFWDVMEQAAENQMSPNGTDSAIKFDRWPRGSERRHFRGGKCVRAVQNMRKFSKDKPDAGAEYIIGFLYQMAHMVDFTGLMNSVQAFPMMGPWIAFKAADVLERVLGAPVEFPNDILTFYKEPRVALDLVDLSPELAANKLLSHFQNTLAPPLHSPRIRKCNIQEVETICCKWKSSLGGHYWVGKDIHEIRQGLKGWGATANILLHWTPREVERGLFE